MSITATRWHDFPIEVTGPPEAPRVRVLGPVPGGEMTAGEAVPVEVTPGLDGLVRKLGRRKATRDQVLDLGGRLGGLLLPGRVRGLFDASLSAVGQDEGLRLRIAVEHDALAALPWEYAHLPRTAGQPEESDFLALRARVSIVRHQVTGAPLDPGEVRPTHRVVLAVAEPDDLEPLDLDRDVTAIRNAITTVDGGEGAIELRIVRPATRAALVRELPDADVLHFAGHGGFGPAGFNDDGTERTEGCLALEDDDGNSDRLTASELAVLLAGTGTRLVVLGACESAARDARGPWSGVASALVRTGTPAVVAMQFKVLDDHAARFMAPFYAAVLGGLPVDDAVHDGRRAVYATAGVTGRDWGTPVLALRTADGVLCPQPVEVPAGDAARSAVLRVRQRIDIVRGKVTGGRADVFLGDAPDVDIAMDVGTVERDGEVVGFSIGRLGGSAHGSEERK